MSEFLFKEFPEISEKEWKQLIQYDLKGADYQKTLVWESLEGIKVQPFYHRDSYEYLDVPVPEEDFQIGQHVYLAKTDIAVHIGRKHLDKGVDVLEYTVNKAFNSRLFASLFEEKKPVHFYFSNPFRNIVGELVQAAGTAPVQVYSDALGQLVKTGKWADDESGDLNKMQDLNDAHPEHYIPLVDASHYHNAGAGVSMQVGYALAHAWEYVNRLEGMRKMRFHFAQGGNYFFEIAKLRAFRYLWKLLNDEHSLDIVPEVTAMPGWRNKTLYDRHVNMLRTASEVMSAVLGGADRVFNHAFDGFFMRSREFSTRIGINQLLLLREENGFQGAQHYAKGSYYIEKLTLEIAKKSLEIFKNIEKKGGWLQSLKSGEIQKKIKDFAAKEQALFDEGKLYLLGTNIYPNEEDKVKDLIELYPFAPRKKQQTHIEPLMFRRLAEAMEEERLQREPKTKTE